MPKTMATVVLFKPSGKYYTTEQWKVPAGAVWPYTMEFSPDFRRIDGGAVLVPEQEPWKVPHLFPAVKTSGLAPMIVGVARQAYENGVRDERALTEILGPPSPEPAAAQEEVSAPIWALRTWTDVRDGDTVRMPGTDATAEVLSALAEPWHVDPKTGTSSWNPPQPLEFTVIHVRMTPAGHRDPRTFDANPAAPVEILIDQVTLDAIELLGGWPNRIRVEQANGADGLAI